MKNNTLKEKINDLKSSCLIYKFFKSRKLDLFRPESVLFFYLVFLGLAVLSFFTNLPISTPSLLSFLVIFISFPFFLAGIKAGKILYGKKVPWFIHILIAVPLILFYSFILKGLFFEKIWTPLLICVFSISIYYFMMFKYRQNKSQLVPYAFIFSGFLFSIITLFSFGGIPLFNHELRYLTINNPLFGISIFLFLFGFMLLLPNLKSKKEILFLTFLSLVFFSLFAFRYIILLILLTGIVYSYYFKKLEITKVAAGLFLAFIIIVFLGYFTMPLTGPFEMLLYRAGTTHIVFDEIVQQAWPFGLTHGSLFLQGNPRLFVGSEIMVVSKSITFTLIGGSFLDFGILGASAWMFLLGILLSLAYKSMREGILKGFYPLMLAFSVVWIELGVDQFQILFFIMFLIAYMLKYTKFPKAQFLKRH